METGIIIKEPSESSGKEANGHIALFSEISQLLINSNNHIFVIFKAMITGKVSIGKYFRA